MTELPDSQLLRLLRVPSQPRTAGKPSCISVRFCGTVANVRIMGVMNFLVFMRADMQSPHQLHS
jgi:hypothetical protein